MKSILLFFCIASITMHSCYPISRKVREYSSIVKTDINLVLINKNDGEKIQINIGHIVDLICENDSLVNEKFGRKWRFDGIRNDSLIVKNTVSIIDTIKYTDFQQYKEEDWTIYDDITKFVSNDFNGHEFTVKSIVRIKKEIHTLAGKNINKIKKIRYAKRETDNMGGEMATPLLILLSPIVPWEDGKFHWDEFFGMIGGAGILFTVFYILPNLNIEFLEYDRNDWEFTLDVNNNN